MAVTLEALPKGHQFPLATFDLSPDWVREYTASVEDSAIPALAGYVPPLAVAALSIRTLLDSAGLPAGAIHLGQELVFKQAIGIGERLIGRARINSRGERGGWVLMGVELVVEDDAAKAVMTGRATITFPAGASAVASEASSAKSDLPNAIPQVDVLQPLTKNITQEKIDRYAVSSGDGNPLHTDPVFAATTRFGGTIAHGMLVLAYISEMMTESFGEAWLSSGTLKIRFRGAARPGDTVTASGRIVGREGNMTRCEVACRNQGRELLISGEAGVSA